MFHVHHTVKYRYYIGIDAGVDTGLAVWDKAERKLIKVQTLLIHQAQEVVKEIFAGNPQTFVRVEDARQRTWFGKVGREVLQGVGSVKRDCKIWEDFLTDLKIPFEMVKPKAKMTEWKKPYFQETTKWKQSTSEHSRDAAVLVWGL